MVLNVTCTRNNKPLEEWALIPSSPEKTAHWVRPLAKPFDLDAYPSEISNVAGSNPTIVTEMQKIITREYKTDLPGSSPSVSSPIYPNHP